MVFDADFTGNFLSQSGPFAISPLDGRYRSVVAPLANSFSEAALNRMRVFVEIEWFITLCVDQLVPGAPLLSAAEVDWLRAIPRDFSAPEVVELGELERQTVHDVKAVEYFIKARLADTGLAGASELVHFGLTSEDVNNLAYALNIKAAVADVWLPAARALEADLVGLAEAWAELPMLARTHGQPATPTTFGKEIAVFAYRLGRQLERISRAEFLGKLNGATGTYGAFEVAVPDKDWLAVSMDFINRLGLVPNPLTTQIESHDWQSELYDDITRVNRILHNLATDCWAYISMGYLAQEPVAGATGSSTMPHKINPIRFENAEANLELSNAVFASLSNTLTTTRLQRDLTDSSTQRNIGVAFGHSLVAIDNLRRGLAAVHPNLAVLTADLAANWEVLAEPIQTVLRTASVARVPGTDNPYEKLKELTRGHRIDEAGLAEFIASLELPAEYTQRLAGLTPNNYIGLAPKLARL